MSQLSLLTGSAAPIPQRYQQILDLLDGYTKGTVSYETILNLDEEEKRLARNYRRQRMNAWVEEFVPEVKDLDQDESRFLEGGADAAFDDDATQ
ncbi:hypothetical protein SAMN05421823_11557 [Catalinimonas alkaloidigena]|uniref:Uncharacterized protein n=1 Tax=Catalinimonas alkaloidigena TaxID=1075417 RepID=A0A1G9U2L7_9BACT|nr:hypothetical protein [Catalinimonas alkaloidigena]SDM53755.1 hypothetical protein SAMN05421823_11557 [Catalinimonas alkaloidigena]